MRWLERSGVVSALVALGLGLAVAGAPSDAAATHMTSPLCAPLDMNCFTFSIELGPQRTGQFAKLELAPAAGGVEFTITLNTQVLGSHANLNEFYFSLPPSFRDDDDVSLISCGSSDIDCTVEDGRPVRGGAGADFDFSIHFDADGGDRIQMVSFVIAGLTVEQVVAAAFRDPPETGRGLEVIFAAHIQGSGHGHGSASATVGVPVPEPGTAALFGLGLAGLAFLGRRHG